MRLEFRYLVPVFQKERAIKGCFVVVRINLVTPIGHAVGRQQEPDLIAIGSAYPVCGIVLVKYFLELIGGAVSTWN